MAAGWTAPFVVSYLGIVTILFADGKIWLATLEFVRYVLSKFKSEMW